MFNRINSSWSNWFKNILIPVKIMEAQLGTLLKETDIVRYQDVYGRVR